MSSTTERRPRAAEESVGVLVSRASEQITELVREEMQLARAELGEKGKRVGTGGGLLGAATLLGVLVAQAVVVSGMAALALVLPVWSSALIVAAVLATIAGVLAVAGKKQIARAGSPVPEQTVNSVKADVAEVKERAHR
ncbi:phage holin family protein [Streptomyces sp. NPDC056883]|uniref:phage holin family protein n=1 Tax=Streptomyces sp. NPDC056883 TaxID=3345959 RepID=UPI0036ACB215